MSLQELEASVAQLPPGDLAEFTQWFEEFQEQTWDEQIARDVRAGRFDAVLRRVNEQAEAGDCRPL